jgi:hypothetical protein
MTDSFSDNLLELKHGVFYFSPPTAVKLKAWLLVFTSSLAEAERELLSIF